MNSYGFFLYGYGCFMKLKFFLLHLSLAFFLISSSGVIFAKEEKINNRHSDTTFIIMEPNRITTRNKTPDGRILNIPPGTRFLEEVCLDNGECWQYGIDGGGDIDQMLQNYCFLDQGLVSNFEPLIAISKIFSLGRNASFKKMNAAPGDLDQYDTNTYICEYIRSTSGSKGKRLWNDYKNKYEKTVELSARAYSLPPQLLSCLILKESSWNPEAVSNTGARCLGQFTTSAKEHVDNIVRSSEVNMPQHIAELNKIREANGGDLVIHKDDSEQHKMNVYYWSTLLRNASYKKIWQAVFGDMKNRKVVTRIPTAFDKAVKEPKKYPHHCIVGTALYLRYIIDEILAGGAVKEKGSPKKQGLEVLKQAHEADKANYEKELKNLENDVKNIEEVKIKSGVASKEADSLQAYNEYEAELKNIASKSKKLKEKQDEELVLYNIEAKKFKDSNWKDSKARESMKNISEKLDGMEKWICEGAVEKSLAVEKAYLGGPVFSEELDRNIELTKARKDIILAKKGIREIK